jgi:hypothetical protein
VIVTEGAEFCPHHLRLAEEFGAELVRGGAVPKTRARPVAEELSVVTATTKAVPLGAIPVPPVWLTIECPNCGERSRVEAPELLARVAGIELMVGRELGRPPDAEEPRSGEGRSPLQAP